MDCLSVDCATPSQSTAAAGKSFTFPPNLNYAYNSVCICSGHDLNSPSDRDYKNIALQHHLVIIFDCLFTPNVWVVTGGWYLVPLCSYKPFTTDIWPPNQGMAGNN